MNLDQHIFNTPRGPKGQRNVDNTCDGGVVSKTNDLASQECPRYPDGLSQGYYNDAQDSNLDVRPHVGAHFVGGNYVSPSTNTAQHAAYAERGFGNGDPQMDPPEAEQQTLVSYNDDDNPFPLIQPGRRNDDARVNPGPAPGWEPWHRQGTTGHNNGQKNLSLQNNGNGKSSQNRGFKNQHQGRRQMSNRGHGQALGSEFGHQSRSTQNSPQGGFQATTRALPPAQPFSRTGMQVDGLQAQAAQQFGSFGTRHRMTRPAPVAPGPNHARVGGTLPWRGQNNGSQRNGNGMQNGNGEQVQGNRYFNAGCQQIQQQGNQPRGRAAMQSSRLVPQPDRSTRGYCINCQSRGHVIEECERICSLCRAGGHKARECRFFGLSAR
ncbi:hypothetical protein BKA65DRAFT_500139 [Rhexocercosporidium sp. MPI-PUGE-AT-0058]|nr:hypothetical protein BKA65DRAFT_500139 [Rhexocercosporidium sp. MPI-PUGE-AT-0058]